MINGESYKILKTIDSPNDLKLNLNQFNQLSDELTSIFMKLFLSLEVIILHL